jgi:hypothetical protein
MGQRTIKISPGGDVECLYDDKLRPVLDKLGDMKVERASNIKFDDCDSLWYIWVNNGPSSDKVYPGYKLREEAIKAEIELLEKNL